MHEHDRSLLLGAAIPTAAVGILAMVIGGVVAGGKGVLGAFLGTVVVLLFFTISLVIVGKASRSGPHAAMNAALITYMTKIIVLFGLLVAFKNTTLFDTKVFGFTIVACTLVWTAFEVRAFTRLKILIIDPDAGGGNSPGA